MNVDIYNLYILNLDISTCTRENLKSLESPKMLAYLHQFPRKSSKIRMRIVKNLK